ncbi:GntR family transcriptional regulator [Actinomyces oris]|uniref:GntR family transcriptional regulator n=1 Tax=Actinomyces oris TaxID=544580 RepID=UPI0007682B67|nr:GntR family transcriptional regulator [Actinomyces oris]AMD98621.1 GntR family transcriptional regulator [Actinomyces oris]
MPLSVVLSNTAGVPIYEQIAQQVRDAILTGQVEADEMLPSIRALARDLRVSVITTTRAYSDLVAEGFLANVPGKGYFVLPRDSELVREQVLREVEEHLDRAVERARLAQLSDEELHAMLQTIIATSATPATSKEKQ